MARKILLADDSVTAQNMGRKILADAGYEVITVNNGSAALKKIAEQKPDLIVLDVYMPGYSGLEVCQRLKDAQETARVPVLLTVGKLEPFKPEESKRVRADGFIVKPFEASELLSALSKLEDKIVPRGEPSKPGRFARVTASLEEGRYDKTVAIEEDSGWKDRISFPAKKKDKAPQKESFDPAGYESTNKDLRTVIEHKLAERPHEPRVEEPRVDLGALAPEGLPKDVTPEEIAALAAAAAQVKGKLADRNFVEPFASEAKIEATAPATPDIASLAAVTEQKLEEKSAQSLSTQPPSTHPLSAQSLSTQPFEEKIEEKSNLAEHKSSEAVPEAATPEAAKVEASDPAHVMAALAGLSSFGASQAQSSGNEYSPQLTPEHAANEPVTMARPGSEAARWSVVSVALNPEEAALSLEHEMQKAYAAFAAAESGHGAAPTAIPENGRGTMDLASGTEAPAESSPPVVSIPALPAPDAAQMSSALEHASTEALRAAVQELETISESYVEEAKAPAAFSQLSPEAPHISAAIDMPAQTAEAETANKDATEASDQEPRIHELQSPPEGNENELRKAEDWKHENSSVATTVPSEATGTSAAGQEVGASNHSSEVAADLTSTTQASAHVDAPASDPAIASAEVTAKTESDAAATTAAAWASWRRIRESAASPASSQDHSGTKTQETSPEAIAMAVAAGAEKTPEEASAESDSDPAAIASIVDSVLADLRPKIFEEISRKMGHKK